MTEKEYEIRKLNLLAFPRDQHPKCELTGDAATVQLICPHCTLYYANDSLAQQAWDGIIHRIAHLLAPLMQSPPIIGTQEERSRRNKNIALSKRSLIDFCIAEAANLLSEQKYPLAIPGAIQALKFCKDVYGDLSYEIVEPNLILAQASLGLNNPRQAEKYLALAKWNVLNDPECSDRVKSRLHQLFGRLHAVDGNSELSKAEFATSIFYSSKCYGAESIPTSAGYVNLGEVFLLQGNIESALAFFDKVIDIWYKYLSCFHTEKSGDNLSSSTQPSEAQLNDGHHHLSSILDHRKRLLGESHIATGEAEYCLGLFHYYIFGNDDSGTRLLSNALNIYEVQLGSAHSSTIHVRAILVYMQQNPWDNDGASKPNSISRNDSRKLGPQSL